MEGLLKPRRGSESCEERAGRKKGALQENCYRNRRERSEGGETTSVGKEAEEGLPARVRA